MALAAHLEQLNNKHSSLDQQILEELKHPAPNEILLSNLKKQKLQIKQKITELQSP